MAVPKELCGTYRQVAHKLRIHSDTPGVGSRTSERPRNKDTGTYLDNGETTVEILPDDTIDVASLIWAGAIVPLPKPKPTPKGKPAKEDDSGETERQ